MSPTLSPITPAAMDAIAQEHFEAEGRADIPAILATYSGNVEFDVVGNPTGATRDRENIAGFYSAIFNDLKDLEIQSIRRYYGTDFMVDESMVTCQATGRPFGLDGQGRTVNFRLLHVFEFADNRISRESGWLDLPAIMAQLA